MAYKTSPILIMHQGALGDLILSLPALCSLRKYHKKNPWTIVGNPEPLDLLQGSLEGANILPGFHKDWAGIFERPVRISATFHQFLNSFEKTYLFAKTFPEDLIQGLTQAGLEQITWIPSFPDETRHRPLQYLQREALKNQGIPWHERDKLFLIPQEYLEKAREVLKPLEGAEPRRPFWAIHPGSGSRHKNWPLEKFIQVARGMEGTGALKPIFLLGPVEEERTFGPLLRQQELTVVSALPLGVLAGILSQCFGYLGNDSGVSHLSAALGLPTVSLFGPTDPFFWGPVGPSVYILSAPKTCSPCSEERRQACLEKACLSGITVEEVLEAVLAGSRANH